ncbi:PKD domain-containing protein [Thiofilum sp.]|uniref:PKD domain-containing protein n=1 Tax=Thiofilum sp. TaxID=2212733 RepID=UPI003BAF3A49
MSILASGCEDQLDKATHSKIEQQFANTFPQAVAGLDQTVLAKSTVLLDASASRDNEGALIQYYWRQLSGSPVTLQNSHTSQASFTAPDLTANTILTFELVVTDNQGWPASDTVNVLVTPSPIAAKVLTGTFIASPQGVSGLSYQTATQSGMTNTAGEFKYLEGESVSFNLCTRQFA